MKSSERVLIWYKDHLEQLVFNTYFLIIFLLNISPGYIIMGLDNSSPWFSLSATIQRIFYSSNFFQYGGLVFSLPFTALSYLNVAPWIISQLFYWTAMYLGLYFGYKLITSRITIKEIRLLVPFLLTSHLAFLWIFSQPTFLFLASFAGTITLIYLLSKTSRNKNSILEATMIVLGLLYFLMTVINPIAFSFYLFAALVIGSILSKNLLKTLKKGLVITVSVIIILQGFTLIHSNHSFIPIEIWNFASQHSSSLLAKEVTDSLRTAEIRNNEITNIIRFAGGWMELNGPQGKEIFSYRSLYTRNIVFVILGFAPVILLAIAAIKGKSKLIKQLFAVLIITSVFSSSYFLLLIGPIPLLRDALRWISSKTWPLLYLSLMIGYILSIEYFLAKLSQTKQRQIMIITAFLSIVYVFPIFTGALINRFSLVTIPDEYNKLEELEESDTLIIYPAPQKLFFRYYDWGYYGTDFVRYITKAQIIDGTLPQFSPENEYPVISRELEKYYILVSPQNNINSLYYCNYDLQTISIEPTYDLLLCSKQ